MDASEIEFFIETTREECGHEVMQQCIMEYYEYELQRQIFGRVALQLLLEAVKVAEPVLVVFSVDYEQIMAEIAMLLSD